MRVLGVEWEGNETPEYGYDTSFCRDTAAESICGAGFLPAV